MTAFSILQTMTINPFQNLIINFLSTALETGGYPDVELYFDQLTPLAILSQQAEDTNKTIDEVADTTNKEMENPATTEDGGANVVDSGIDNGDVLQMSNPNFTKEFEIYKQN